MASNMAQAVVQPLDLAALIPSMLLLVFKASPFGRSLGQVLPAGHRRFKIGFRADLLLSIFGI